MCILSGCQNNLEHSEDIYAMDTVMTIKAYGIGADDAILKAKEKIFSLDVKFDRKDKNNELNTVNMSDETKNLISRAKIIGDKTNGAFDITIAPIMDLWGFYGQEYRVPSDTEIREKLKNVSYKNVEISDTEIIFKNNAQIDLGGIAKGYASDITAKIIKDNGIKSAIISLGGNIMAIGKRTDGTKWKVGIQNPDKQEEYIGILEIEDKAVVTSGGYERKFEEKGIEYHHIIDPKTGYPANSGLKSVTIVSDSGEYADGLSTALYVLGLAKGTKVWQSNKDFDVVFITDNNEIYITYGLEGCFKSQKDYKIIK